jgi:hypothetical protein
MHGAHAATPYLHGSPGAEAFEVMASWILLLLILSPSQSMPCGGLGKVVTTATALPLLCKPRRLLFSLRSLRMLSVWAALSSALQFDLRSSQRPILCRPGAPDFRCVERILQ